MLRRNKTEMKKEDYIWRRKRIFQRRRKLGKGNEEYIWRQKIYFFCGGEDKQKRKRRKIFGEGRYVFCAEE